MNSSLSWISTRSSISKLLVHLVFVVKYRRKALTHEILLDAESICLETAAKAGFEMIEFGGEADHIHLLVQIPPTLAVCQIVKVLKGNTSRLLRAKHRGYLKRLLWGNHLWSPSYCAVSCGGASLETIKRYIESQDLPP